jgi:hypothetical protein
MKDIKYVDELDDQTKRMACEAPQWKGRWYVPFDQIDEVLLKAHVEVMSLPERPVEIREDSEGNPIFGGAIVIKFQAPLEERLGHGFQVGDKVLVDGDQEGTVARRREDSARNGLVHVLYEVELKSGERLVVCPEKVCIYPLGYKEVVIEEE